MVTVSITRYGHRACLCCSSAPDSLKSECCVHAFSYLSLGEAVCWINYSPWCACMYLDVGTQAAWLLLLLLLLLLLAKHGAGAGRGQARKALLAHGSVTVAGARARPVPPIYSHLATVAWRRAAGLGGQSHAVHSWQHLGCWSWTPDPPTLLLAVSPQAGAGMVHRHPLPSHLQRAAGRAGTFSSLIPGPAAVLLYCGTAVLRYSPAWPGRMQTCASATQPNSYPSKQHLRGPDRHGHTWCMLPWS